MPNKFTYKIKCNICGVQTGSIELDRKYFDEKTTTDETLGFTDNRCDADIIKHGSFKELVAKAQVVLGDATEAEDFVKLHRKQKDVEKELSKLSVTIQDI